MNLRARRYRSSLAAARRAERGRQPLRDQCTAAVRIAAAGPAPATLPDPTKEN